MDQLVLLAARPGPLGAGDRSAVSSGAAPALQDGLNR
jgi:hypothetical protein